MLLIELNVLTVGCDAAAPLPLHSDFNSPNFDGFEVDLMRAVSSHLGLSVKYKSALWSEIIEELKLGRIDAICSAATVTKERENEVDFSDPYLDFQLAVVVKHGSSVREFGDLKDKIIGVRVATSAEDYVRANAGAKQIITFDMNTDAYETLQTGKVDAIVDDSPIAKSFVSQMRDLKMATFIDGTNSQYAIVLRKGNDDLRNAINNG